VVVGDIAGRLTVLVAAVGVKEALDLLHRDVCDV
jgi:hypothetical protein